ncbi:hypothetical protein [Heliophilum fasciatum]|uniref:Uncharacterized protein n=1 Tax=Heliophilum fasciatum TaxID=35700 RepID=A0A4R2RRN6_9FIRM|nr:hypothetical protein [Heliophilum fasciatum]MCW2278720.1 hypothetical protein [Heliophilum fasciatum]TCP62541.1 hypothetical protein EDD73_12139 [Heliophilum fasciatum]
MNLKLVSFLLLSILMLPGCSDKGDALSKRERLEIEMNKAKQNGDQAQYLILRTLWKREVAEELDQKY